MIESFSGRGVGFSIGVFCSDGGIRWSKVLIFDPKRRMMYVSPPPTWRAKSDDACATFIVVSECLVDGRPPASISYARALTTTLLTMSMFSCVYQRWALHSVRIAECMRGGGFFLARPITPKAERGASEKRTKQAYFVAPTP